MQSKIAELLHQYFELGVAEGREGRIHDTEAGDAQRVLSEIEAEISALSYSAPIAWESTTPGYIKYVTDMRYSKFSGEVKKWYKPFRCSSCASALSAQVQDVATARDALHAIANLPTGKNIDVCQGHEEAYRAVEALFSTPPKIQVQDVAKPDDELFWRLRIAYKRGAEWRDTTGSMHLVDKASYDYADKITSPLPAAPAKQEG